MNLTTLSHEYLAVLAEIEANEGEITAEQETRLEAICRDLAGSADKADWVLKKLDAESEFYAARIKELQAYKKALDNAQDRFKRAIKDFMAASGQNRIQGEYVDLVLRAAKAKTVVDDESKIPEAYFETTIVRTLNKQRLYDDLKLGVPVAGAHLADSHALTTTRRKS